jgi:hypothetical protein
MCRRSGFDTYTYTYIYTYTPLRLLFRLPLLIDQFPPGFYFPQRHFW